MDTDDNTPEGTVEDASDIDVLADILNDPEMDTDEDDAQEADTKDPIEDDEEGAEDFDEDTPDDDGDKSENDQYDSGKFAADNAKVKLSDGSTITIAELKKGSLRQSDYTRKAQELAEGRKAFEAEREQASQVAQQLQESHQQAMWWLEQTRPQQPQASFAEDPMAWGEYRENEAQWQQAAAHWQAEQQKATDAKTKQTAELAQKRMRSEAEALFTAVPQLRDPIKREAFIRETAKVSTQHYGLSEQEVRNISDHRVILALKDAMAYRRMKERAPKVKQDIEKKPKMVRGSKRSSLGAVNKRDIDAKTERFRKDGSLDSFTAAIDHLDI